MKKVIVYLFTVFLLLSCKTLSEDDYLFVEININGLNEINTISDKFFGQNYWSWPPTWNSYIDGTESLISPLNIKLLRFGGIPGDIYQPDPVNSTELIKFHNYCLAIGAEPYIQVPLAKFADIDDKKQGAIDFLDMYSAIDTPYYVSIGNEPDIYHSELYENYGIAYLENYSVDDYINDFKAVSAEIKRNYPSVKIIGMDLAYNQEWITPFLSECRDYIDIFSMHHYAFMPDQCTYENARADYDVIINYYNYLRWLIDSNSSGKSIPIIISENNVSIGSRNPYLEADAGTFYGGLWMADFIGISSSQQNLLSIMPWGVADDWNLGFLHAADYSNPAYKEIRPVYYIYKMFSNFIKPHMIHNEKVNNDLRIYSYKDNEGNAAVFVVNWSKKNGYKADITFSNLLNNEVISYDFAPSSLTCLSISADLTDKKAYVYTKENADSNSEYTVNTF